MGVSARLATRAQGFCQRAMNLPWESSLVLDLTAVWWNNQERLPASMDGDFGESRRPQRPYLPR